MKKIMAICLMTVMLVALSVNAFAAPNGFVSSPSGVQAPELESFTGVGGGICDPDLVVVPYGEREELPETLRNLLDDAYNQIVNAKNVTDLSKELVSLVGKLKLNGENLAVSHLFDIHCSSCYDHNEKLDITLDAATLSHFVALLHMTDDGKWELVEDAEISEDGKHLKFSVDSLSPFAIVVNTNPQVDEPTDWTWLYILIALIVLAVIIIIIVKSKKKKD